MKILFIMPSMFPNGPVRVLLSIAPELRKNGHEVKFWYFDDLEGAEQEDAQRISFFNSPSFKEYNIVHSIGIRPDAFVRFHFKKIKAPTVTTMMNYVEEDLKFQYSKWVSFIFTPIWKFAIKKHTVVVAQQENMKHYYETLWGLKNQEVIALCSLFKKGETSIETVNRIKSFIGKHKSIVSVSLVTQRKGLSQIVELLKLKENHDLKWVHIGGGKELEDLKLLVKSAGIENSVLFLGQTPNSAAYMPLFNAYVMPSFSEGFGLALLEAVIQKVPAITTNIDVFKIIFNQKEVPKFSVGDINSFDQILQTTLANPKIQIDFAYKRYQQDYTIAAVTQKYIKLYNALIKKEWKAN